MNRDFWIREAGVGGSNPLTPTNPMSGCSDSRPGAYIASGVRRDDLTLSEPVFTRLTLSFRPSKSEPHPGRFPAIILQQNPATRTFTPLPAIGMPASRQ